MQLRSSASGSRPSGGIRVGLAAATGVLLGVLPRGAVAGQIEGSTLVYSEPGRVSALETVIEGNKTFENGRVFSLRLALDALTGASANGAVPSRQVQTFTRPSGQDSYSVSPGATPLDPTFRDTRIAASGTLTLPMGRLTTSNLGVNLSTEADYLSLGASFGISHDLAQRNTTLAAGISLSHDEVNPQGGAPVPFAPMAPPSAGGRSEEDDEGEGEGGGPGKAKEVGDLQLGVTQVLDRAMIARVNYTVGVVSGYLTDPYKLLSVVEGPEAAGAGDPVDYLYESRPDRRVKQSVYGELRRRLGGDMIQASYRYYWDDWSVGSSTLDLRYSRRLGARTSLEPHYRHYEQTRADFYRTYLVDGDPLPAHASADYRLGAFDADTAGLEAVHTLASGTVLRLGLEYYLQRGDSSPPAFGALVGQDLFPDVSAWMVRVGASVPVTW